MHKVAPTTAARRCRHRANVGTREVEGVFVIFCLLSSFCANMNGDGSCQVKYVEKPWTFSGILPLFPRSARPLPRPCGDFATVKLLL